MRSLTFDFWLDKSELSLRYGQDLFWNSNDFSKTFVTHFLRRNFLKSSHLLFIESNWCLRYTIEILMRFHLWFEPVLSQPCLTYFDQTNTEHLSNSWEIPQSVCVCVYVSQHLNNWEVTVYKLMQWSILIHAHNLFHLFQTQIQSFFKHRLTLLKIRTSL